MRIGSSSIATLTWMICANTKRKHCDVRPEPRPVQPSTVLAAVQTAARRLRRWPAASLDHGCARRSIGGQVGTKGWSCPIEQRDANFDLSSAGPPPMTDLLNLAHTTGETRRYQPFARGPRNRGDRPTTDLRCTEQNIGQVRKSESRLMVHPPCNDLTLQIVNWAAAACGRTYRYRYDRRH